MSSKAIGVAAFSWLIIAIFLVSFGTRLATIFLDGKPAAPASTGVDFGVLSSGAVSSIIAAFYGVTLSGPRDSRTGSILQYTLAGFGSFLTAGAGSPTAKGIIGAVYSVVYVAVAFMCFLAFQTQPTLTPEILVGLASASLGTGLAVATLAVATA
jgi:hypothetical protein